MPPDDDAALIEELRATTELLERIAADWGLLDRLPAEVRRHFHRAVALMADPNPKARRKKAKAVKRSRKAAAAERDDTVLNETGIRALRRRPVVSTPNVFPPKGFEPRDLPVDAAPEHREALDPRCCYVCKQDYSVIHHFYDHLCPPCAELNFAKRTELADLRGRVALVTGARVKIGYQAGLKLLRAGAHLIVTTGSPAIRRRATPGSLISPSGRTVSRSSGSISVTRGASRRFAASCSPRAAGWTSSSTTHARPSGVRPSFTPT